MERSENLKHHRNGVFLLLLFAAAFMFSTGCRDENTMTDIDGNRYRTVKIGNQIWMAENLRVKRYRNGNPVRGVTDHSEWGRQTEGAFCSYNNDTSLADAYGLLYNWYAVNDKRNLAPEGWHIPAPEEIEELILHLEGDTLAAAKLKEQGYDHWIIPNDATNESGFSGLPGGYRLDDGSFHTLGSNGYWWTMTGSFEMYSWSRRLYTSFADVDRDRQYMNYGFSVRCIKDRL